MINVIVPIVENVDNFLEFLQSVNRKDVKFFVGIKESLFEKFRNKNKLKNVEVHVFSNKSNIEEIVNALHSCKMKSGKILLARRPLSEQEFESLTNSNSDIVTLRAKHNKFVNFIKNLGMKIVRKFFAFSYFEDISAICYGENMFDLLSVCKNFSMASRVNKYVGVSIEEIETEKKQVRKEFNRPLAIFKFLFWSLILAGSIAGAILICIFVNQWAITIIAVMCWILLALMIWLAALVNFTRTLSVGNLRYGKAEEIALSKPRTEKTENLEKKIEESAEKTEESEKAEKSEKAERIETSENSEKRKTTKKQTKPKTSEANENDSPNTNESASVKDDGIEENESVEENLKTKKTTEKKNQTRKTQPKVQKSGVSTKTSTKAKTSKTVKKLAK